MKPDTPRRPDELLDDLFRRAAEAYEPPFEPRAWKRMQQKLDAGTRPLVRRLYLWGVLELLLVLALLALVWTYPGRGAAADGRAQARPPEAATGTALSGGLRPVPDGPAGGTPRSEAVVGPKRAPRVAGRVETIPTSEAARRGTGPIGTSLPTKNSKVAQQDAARPGAARPEEAGRTRPGRTQISRPTVRFTRPDGTGSGPTARGVAVRRVEPGPGVSPTASNDPQPTGFSVALLRRRPVEQAVVRARLPEPVAPEPIVRPGPDRTPPRLPRWSGLVLLSPDATTVPGRGVTAPSWNAGLQLEFRPLRRWRVGVGASYTTKLYDASSYDYRPYPGYWQRWGRPDRITADCRMIELPLSLRYDVWQGARSSWSVSAGTSSYLMLRETYQYQYASGRTYPHTAERSGNHFWATVNLSAAYERTFSRRLALRAEPFVRLPQGGVGFGQVRLRTAGVAVGLRYSLNRP
jgi:hypothetical protein